MAFLSRLWKLPICRNPGYLSDFTSQRTPQCLHNPCGRFHFLGCRFAAFSTSSKSAVKPKTETVENEAVAPEFTNRNPRNLELLGVARKERGWGTVWPSREFWHRLRVIRTQHHVEALVEHWNGRVVVSASTREWAIKKHLYSTRNVVACETIGRVLAQRCLEAGVNFMVYQPTPWEAAADSIKRLQNAMTEGGIVLQEPRRIYE
ncbi:large ribosomal subunit protein uL18m isoform X1 [Cavia porcellus]|uniref:Large ribosomal subunit protein uL18m n=1 Tax=Cavia porcellus TaxID=10141 RepID=A0A286XUY9_CAVPO|nr:39S ribosomal protein L18, mitochondrial isoform X1 [Cavia porcellus]